MINHSALHRLRLAARGLLTITASAIAFTSAFADDEGDGFLTSIKPYIVPTAGSPYAIVPVLSVGDKVPETSNPARLFQMVGIPDGLGARPNDDGTITLFMNHELARSVVSQATIGGPAERGAFVSKYLLADDGSVLSGERAYDFVYDTEQGLTLPAPDTSNGTPPFARFCSGALAGPEEGFDRPIYFCGEESGGANTFDGKGGLCVAIIDNVAYTLPKLGHLPWENAVPRPHQGNEVVIMCMEDGPSTPDSQLYMYVGKKVRKKGTDVLSRNGLNNGTLYVFRSKDRTRNSEVTFQTGTITGEWVAISDAETKTDVLLEAASDAREAFGFIRIEDGAWSKTSRKDYYFCTTGSSFSAAPGVTPANKLGRIYHVELNPGNVLQDAKLTILVNADLVAASGGDTAVSPDNMDTSAEYLMVQEDGTSESRLHMASKGRDGSVWRFPLATSALPRASVLLSSIRRVATACRSAPGSGNRAASLMPRRCSGMTHGFSTSRRTARRTRPHPTP